MVLAEFFADPLDMYVHGSGIAEKVEAPDLFKQLLALNKQDSI